MNEIPPPSWVPGRGKSLASCEKARYTGLAKEKCSPDIYRNAHLGKCLAVGLCLGVDPKQCAPLLPLPVSKSGLAAPLFGHPAVEELAPALKDTGKPNLTDGLAHHVHRTDGLLIRGSVNGRQY